MSFNIKIQTNNSEPNRVNKDLTNILTLSGELKQDTSIIDPVFIVEGNLSDFVGCNYLTVENFGRSYFVNDIRTVRNRLIEISAHSDVLSSFADELLQNSAIIKRQKTKYNLYLNDGSFRVYQNPYILTKYFPNGFSSYEFVLAVAGN